MYQGVRKVLCLTGSLLGIWIFLHFLLPLCFPFLLGGALALASEPLVHFLCTRLKFRRGAAAGVGVTTAFCFLTLVLLSLLALIFRQLGLLVSLLPDLQAMTADGIAALSQWFMEQVSRLPESLRSILSPGVSSFFSGSSQMLGQAFRYVMSLTGKLLTQVPDSALILGTAIISSYMISAKLPRIRGWLRERIPRERIQKLLDGFRRLKSALLSWLKAQAKLMGLTWLILTMGLVLLRVPYAPLWAAAVGLVDAFPILGTGTVLLPWSLICFLRADSVRAVGILGIYTVISLTRSVMEPKLVGDQLGLDPLVTLAALYAGYQIWGFGGIIIAPVLAVAAAQLIRTPER